MHQIVVAVELEERRRFETLVLEETQGCRQCREGGVASKKEDRRGTELGLGSGVQPWACMAEMAIMHLSSSIQ